MIQSLSPGASRPGPAAPAAPKDATKDTDAPRASVGAFGRLLAEEDGASATGDAPRTREGDAPAKEAVPEGKVGATPEEGAEAASPDTAEDDGEGEGREPGDQLSDLSDQPPPPPATDMNADAEEDLADDTEDDTDAAPARAEAGTGATDPSTPRPEGADAPRPRPAAEDAPGAPALPAAPIPAQDRPAQDRPAPRAAASRADAPPADAPAVANRARADAPLAPAVAALARLGGEARGEAPARRGSSTEAPPRVDATPASATPPAPSAAEARTVAPAAAALPGAAPEAGAAAAPASERAAEFGSLSAPGAAATEARSATAPQAAPPAAPPAPVRQVMDAIVSTQGDRLEVALSPEELGRVRITINQGEGGLTIHLAADRDDTMGLLRRHAADLGRAFAEMGLGSADIDFGDGRSESPERDPRKPRTPLAFAMAGEADPSLSPTRPRLDLPGRMDLRI